MRAMTTIRKRTANRQEMGPNRTARYDRGPEITKMLDSYPATADDTRKPYIMFGGTPYEHVMFPVQ